MSSIITKKEPSKRSVVIAFIALYLIWGSTYLANLFAIKSIPPFIMGGSRFLAAGLLLFFWCIAKGDRIPSVSSISKISLCGILMLSIGTGAVIWAEQFIPSGLTAIIVATVPLWFVALDKREWHLYFSNKWIITGLLVGFIGVLLLFAGKGTVNFTGDRMQLISFFVLTIGSISWAIGSLYSKYQQTEGSTAMKAAIQMMSAGVVSFFFAFIAGEYSTFSIHTISFESIKAVIYLVLFGSLIGYMAYIWLLSVRPPSQVGTYAYVNPVVAVFLGWLLADEKISTQQIIALCVVLAGVIMVNFSKENKQRTKQKQSVSSS
jgi:drug/metabolite transporter (DMT)-like permease